jgi:hypothetical protein
LARKTVQRQPRGVPLDTRQYNDPSDAILGRNQAHEIEKPMDFIRRLLLIASVVGLTYISADVPPIYLVHGAADDKAPVSHVDDFVRALRAAGAKDITYKRYADGTGHGAYVKHIEEARPAREAFLMRTLRE